MMETKTDINFIFPGKPDFDNLCQMNGEEPFSENAIEYLNALSEILINDGDIKSYHEIRTFAFFCRKGNLLNLKKKYLKENVFRLGRGLIFHITPANMPVTFAYSLAFGIISGNVNIVKVSSKKFAQAEIICRAIGKLSSDNKYEIFSKRNILISYDGTNDSLTSRFSSMCDVRIIWGGNSTIDEVRKSKLPPHSFDVTFADRYSLCVINAENLINEKSPEIIASGFYNDTYLFDQNACSSPHLIIWTGNEDNIEAARKEFWKKVYDQVKSKYELKPLSAVNKLINFYFQAINSEGIKKFDMPDNLIWRTELKELSKGIENYRCHSGYFSEYKATSLNEISSVFSKKFQTLSYYGYEKEDLIQFIMKTKAAGIDRIITVGKTTEFSLIHDGFNFIDTLTREIEVV